MSRKINIKWDKQIGVDGYFVYINDDKIQIPADVNNYTIENPQECSVYVVYISSFRVRGNGAIVEGFRDGPRVIRVPGATADPITEGDVKITNIDSKIDPCLLAISNIDMVEQEDSTLDATILVEEDGESSQILYRLLDSSRSVVADWQESNLFAGLTNGDSYIAQVIDDWKCEDEKEFVAFMDL